MKYTVNKAFVEELVREHVLMDNGIEPEDFREVTVSETEDAYIVDVVLKNELDTK